ncbi:MAG: amidohydrolase family protein, partial [Gammaproteobacteria bacterium]|nr:amidohydrolase family protein [Gammaproteobacteria bacterium]
DKVPTRWDLDEMSPDNPVILTRGPHTYLLNSRALQIANINRDTPDPEGGWIFRDENGEPNGRILEAAKRLVDAVAPNDEVEIGYEQGITDMRTLLYDLVTLGITSVNISGIRPDGIAQVQDLYDRYGEALPRATMQVRLRPGHDTYDDVEFGIQNEIQALEGIGFHTGFGDDRLKLGAIKMSIDGGLSAPVFWSLEEYKDRPGFHGAIRIPAEVFYPVAKRAHELGWQLGVHTMGDGAVKMVAEQMSRILNEHPRDNHRHYMHHVAVKPPQETIKLMADNNIMVASQPAFTVGLGAYAQEALTPDRERSQNPTRSLQEAGIIVSHGSDTAPYSPLLTVWTAVTRTGFDGNIYGPEEAVSIEEAIRLHTVAPAYFTFDENIKGSIEPGKLADFVILSDNILEAPPEQIRNITINRVFIGGKEILLN